MANVLTNVLDIDAVLNLNKIGAQVTFTSLQKVNEAKGKNPMFDEMVMGVSQQSSGTSLPFRNFKSADSAPQNTLG